MDKRKTGGFASMDSQRQKEIASMGGRAAHLRGTAHKFSSEEAKLAGAKGGKTKRARLLSPPPTKTEQE